MKDGRKVKKIFSICTISILLYALLIIHIFLFLPLYVILLQIFIFILIEREIVNHKTIHISIAYAFLCNV